MKPLKKRIKGNSLKPRLWEISVPTEHGTFFLRGTERGVSELVFPGSKKESGVIEKEKPAPEPLKKAALKLRRYFETGKRDFSSIPFDLSARTSYQREILKKLAKLPDGTLTSYARLGGQARYARAVGSVMRTNVLPVFIPCHRVLASDGSLNGFSAGLGWKKRLLALEGISPGSEC